MQNTPEILEDFFRPELPPNTIYHVGVSGGKDSGAVLLWMVHKSGIPKHQINATFCDTGNEHEWTYEQVRILSKIHPIETLYPDLDFYDLVRKKGVFPSARRRFCTEHLKIRPSQDHIQYLKEAHDCVVAVSGVRGNESADRATYLEWDFSGHLLTLQWRPLIAWKFEDVLAIHREFNVPMNKLYDLGAERVGCYPCINSRKKEIRTIALNFPDRIDRIRDLENELWLSGKMTGFFHSAMIPERYRTRPFVTKDGEAMNVARIDDVVEWSMTGKRAKGSYLDDAPEPISCSSGFCE